MNEQHNTWAVQEARVAPGRHRDAHSPERSAEAPTGWARQEAGATSEQAGGAPGRPRSARRTGRSLLRAAAFLPLVLLLGSLAGLWGCEESAGPPPDNIPPITYLSVQGADLDTLGYEQALYWWGTDMDGEVIGYILRWDGDWNPDPRMVPWPQDPNWYFTTATADTFIVPIAGPYAEWTFSVRSVDDRGAADPEGKSQTFRLKNGVPSLRWSPSLPPPASSLPAVSFAWNPKDSDGITTIAEYRYWLDGMDSTLALSTTDTLVALRPEDLEERYGLRTISVQAIDEAGAQSNIIRHSWTVEEPQGRFMLLDNIGRDVPGYATDDAFYRAMLDSVSPGDYFVYDLDARGGFRTPAEVEPLFSLFQGVVWYSGVQNQQNDRINIEQLKMAESGIREYLDSGGRFLLISRTAVGDNQMNDNWGLTMDFAREYLGVEQFYMALGTTDLDLPPFSYVRFPSQAGSDSLRVSYPSAGADYMVPAEGIQALAWVRPNFLDPTGSRGVAPDQSEDPAYLGLLSRRHGRFALFTFLPSRTIPPADRNRIVAELFREVLGD